MVRKQVELGAVFPSVAGNHIQTVQLKFGCQVQAHAGINVFKDVLHGEDGRPAVNGSALHLNLPNLAPRGIGCLYHRDLKTGIGQQQRADQSGHACAHHHHVFISHEKLERH